MLQTCERLEFGLIVDAGSTPAISTTDSTNKKETTMSKVEVGNNITVHYKGMLSDGTEFDNSYVRERPIDFQVGSGQMIAGFDKAVLGMSEGQTKTVTLTEDDGYGPRYPEAVEAVPRTAFPTDFEFATGGTVQGNGPNGQFLATIVEFNDTEVQLDMNHPLAGKELTFEIELVKNQSSNATSSATDEMLTGLKVSELRTVAKERGLKGYAKLKKAELLELLSA